MCKRVRWVLLVIAVAILWLAWNGAGGKRGGPVSGVKPGTADRVKPDPGAAIAPAERDADEANNRESSRHSAGEIETRMRHSKEQQKMQLESQLSSLQKYQDEQLMVYAAGLEVPGNEIEVLYPQYLALNRELEALKLGGLANAHPTVKAKVGEIDAMKQQMSEGVVRLRAGLKAQLEASSKRR